MKRILVLLFSMLTLAGYAQYPITSINIAMPGNTPANTADWAAAMPPVMITAQAQMRNGQVPGEVQESKILVTIKQGGSKKYGSYTQDNAPSAGFNTAVKNWSGGNATALLGNGITLSPGTYELCVQFFTYNTPAKPLSNEVCKTFTIQGSKDERYNPPVNITPADKKIFTDSEIKAPITFRWTPILPRPQEPVTYKLRVWQIKKGQTATSAAKLNTPVVAKDINNRTEYVKQNLMGDLEMLSKEGAELVWNVQAVNKDNKPIGENNGNSEPSGFKIIVGNAGGCFALDTTKYSIVCTGQNSNGKYVFKVNNLLINYVGTNSTDPCSANSGISLTNQGNYISSQTPSSNYTINNIIPATIPIINIGNPQSFSFNIVANSANPGAILLYANFYSQCAGAAGIAKCPIEFPIKFDDLPSCNCTYCATAKIDLPPATKAQTGNNINISQPVSTLLLPASAPLDIKSIKAEITYLEIKKTDTLCYRCEKNGDHFGKFKTANLVNTTGFTPANTFPGDEAIFNATTPKAITNGSLNFEIALPDILKCCSDEVTVCILYTMVTKDCKVCSNSQCYTIARSK